ncbi:glycosyltransferase family 39 protein, partial [Geomonas sp.]|uniref:glycosyltransferase family 39 protein n=1 Tax=Geomonas sp. TaxID=2651584 RepID=UPI002B46E3F1
MDWFTRYLENEQQRWRDITLLVLVFGLVFFQRLGNFPLLGTDEVRYLEIPREMLERGDFITPTLNYVTYFEKPPLHYWSNALATVLFGETPFAARFFGALWGLLDVLLVYHLGRKLFGRSKGLLAACVLGSSIGVIVQGRTNITDTTLTFFLCAALGSFLLASRPQEPRKALYYYLFYAFSALAVLAKGLIGVVLPGGIIVLFILCTRRWSLLREMRLPLGIPLFLLICAPWFVLVSLRNPDFFQFFFVHEHFQRFLTKVHHRYEPAWYFIPILFGCMLPWSFFLPAALWRSRKLREESGEERLFLLLWGGLIFLFFSVSHSKLIPYILPVYPAFALLVGFYLGELIEARRQATATAAAISFCYLVCGVGLAAYPWVAKHPRLAPVGAALVGVLFLAHGLIALLGAKGRLPRLVAGLGLCSLVTAALAPPVFYEGIAKRKLSRDLALMVNTQAGKDAVIASFGYQQELPLYTRRRVLVVGSPGELEFGSKKAPDWFISEESFAALWQGPRPVYAMVPKDYLFALQHRLT